MKRFALIILQLALSCMLLVSCQWAFDKRHAGARAVDIKVHRYDRLLDEYLGLNSFSALQKLNAEYAQETKFLIEDVLTIGSVTDENINLRLREYFLDSTLIKLRHDALKKFEDMEQIEKQFTRGFRFLKREMPGLEIPRVYAQLSALNQSVIVGDSVLGFSIDKYMGEDYYLYKNFYYDYQRRSMVPERIVPDCFRFYLLSEYPFPWEWHRTLLDHIVHRGKILWVVHQMLGYDTFEKTLGFTEREVEWCHERRDSVWNFLIETGHLHSTDPMLVRIYLNAAPCTYTLGENAPAEVGNWLGLHIVDEYMKKNKEVTVAELFRDTDYREVLKKAGIPY